MRTLLNSRHWSHQGLCELLIALTVAGPGVVRAQQSADKALDPQQLEEVPTKSSAEDAPRVNNDKTLLADPAIAKAAELNLSCVLPNSCLVVAVRPAQVLKSPAVEMYPTEVIQAAMMKEMGIDPLAAEQVVACVVPPVAGPPSYSILAKFASPVQLKPSDLTKHTEPGTLNGTPYFKSKEPMAPSIYMLDDQTVLAAPEYSMPQLVSAKTPPAAEPLAAKLAAAAQGDDLLAFVDVEPLRPFIQMGLAQAELPPELPALREIPALVKTIEVRINFSHAGATEAIVAANNEADAQKLVGIFDQVKQTIAAKAAEQAKQALASQDPVEQAAGRYSQRMTKFWDSRLQLTREGDRLVLFRLNSDGSAQSQLMTVAVSGVLVALLLPAVQAAREAARRAQSTNNLKQIMLALLNYESVKKALPAQAILDANGKPLLSWRVAILPFIEEQTLYSQFRLDEPWDSPNNKSLLSKMPAVFVDPSSKLSPTDGRTNYLGVAGAGRVFEPGARQGRKLRTITDGLSQTLAVVQVDDQHAVEWTKPQDWEMNEGDPLAGLGGLHSGDIILAGFCDGSVMEIAKAIDQQVLKAILTVAGGEAARR